MVGYAAGFICSLIISSFASIGGYIGSHGPGSVVGDDGDAGTVVEKGVRGVLGSAVVFVVVRVVMPGEAASTLSMLELSGVGEIGEAGQLEPPSVESDRECECVCVWERVLGSAVLSRTKTWDRRDL
jgi:hypothetical protein